MKEVKSINLRHECEDFGLAVKLHCKCMQGALDGDIAPWGKDECEVLSDKEAKVLIDYHSRTCQVQNTT